MPTELTEIYESFTESERQALLFFARFLLTQRREDKPLPQSMQWNDFLDLKGCLASEMSLRDMKEA